VITPAGTSAITAADQFTYTVPPPVITSLSISTACSGTVIQINGTGFGTNFGDNTIIYNGFPYATALTTRHSNQLHDPGRGGTAPLYLTNAGGHLQYRPIHLWRRADFLSMLLQRANNAPAGTDAWTTLRRRPDGNRPVRALRSGSRPALTSPVPSEPYTFQLATVPVYGGFAGGETLLSQRNWVNNPTILSGDINSDENASTCRRRILPTMSTKFVKGAEWRNP